MSEPLYNVVFNSQLRPGFSTEQVKQSLQQALKLPANQVDNMLSATRTIIKRDLDLTTARKYEQKLFTMGLMVKLESAQAGSSAVFAIDDPQDEIEQQAAAQEPAAKAVANNVDPETGWSLEPKAEKPVVAEAGDVDVNAEAAVAGAVAASGETAAGAAEDSAYPKAMNFEFSGDGKEYFKIWIVNILLSIVTLGIYSAWAKVRDKQYFYGNTTLDGASFEYTAKPLTILKGRLIAFAIVGLFFFIAGLLPPTGQIIAYGIWFLVFIFLMPWVIVKGLQFNAYHSRYRNISFGFDGTYGGAFKAFILWPMAGIIFIFLPFSWHRQNHYFVNNSRYGTQSFEFTATTNNYFRILGMMIAVGLGLGIAVMVLGGIVGWIASAVFGSVAVAAITGLLYLVFYIAMYAYFKTSINNLLYNSTLLKEHSFVSDYDVVSYTKLLVSNAIGILLTLGLFTPWALVRTARYHADNTNFIAAEDLNTFVAGEEQQVNVIADGLADSHDLFDAGVGI